MVPYKNDEFLILGGYGNGGNQCDVTLHSTYNQSQSGIFRQHRILVKTNRAGHTKFETSGN